MLSRVRSVLATLLLAAATPAVLAQPFTYQGQLTDTSVGTGTPSEGFFDFEFRIFATASGGAQVGVTASAPHTQVTKGVFTAQVDPGAGVFTGGGPDRWLEIAVRPEGTGPFTTLAPRQKINPSPYAVRALSEWFSPVLTDTLTNDASRPKVLLNRTNPVTTAEYFGFTTPTTAGGFGGMYVNTADASGLPFYGYATGGTPRTYTYYQPADSSWRLSIGNVDRVVVANGKLGVGLVPTEAVDAGAGNARAASFKFSAPKVRHLSIPPCAFTPRTPAAPSMIESSNGGAYYEASVADGNFCAPIQLPDGARITNITTWVIDNSTLNNLEVYLFTRGFGDTGYNVGGSGITTGASAAVRTVPMSLNLTVNNATTAYQLTVYCSDWEGSATQFKGAMVTYEVSEAD